MTRNDGEGGSTRSAGGCLGFIGGLIKLRVDDDFLEWYFDYWNQQVLGLKSIWYWSVIHDIEAGIVRGLNRNGMPAAKPAEPAEPAIQETFAKPAYDDPLLDPNLK